MDIESLDKDFTLLPFASCASCYLAKHLKGAFVSPEIRLVEQLVCIQNCHQGNIVEMKPLGYHLRTDEDVTLMTGETVDNILVCRFAAGGVQIHTENFGFREEVCHLVFQTLGTESAHLQLASAVGAEGEDRVRVAAPVTPQFVLFLMKRERYIALHTAGRMTALAAL